jgi:hypothetical protein
MLAGEFELTALLRDLPVTGLELFEQPYNFAVAESWLPQFEQVRASGVAHSSQNFAPERFSCWHRGHCISPPESGPVEVGTAGRD